LANSIRGPPHRCWREPLLHFLALGALLFLLFNWRGAGCGGSNRIVITPGQIDSMVATFTRTWQRPPTEQELKGLVDDHVREEIATREAMALGLDRDDTVIRRRLRQKLEFVAEDSIDTRPPTEAQLQAWLDAHPDQFRIEPQVAFRQVYVSPDRRGAAADADARNILAHLSLAGPSVALDAIGDPLMLPNEVPLGSRTDIARQFGEEFADAVLKIAPGSWAGPVRSGYGLHIVYVGQRREGRSPALAEVRPVVEREFLSDRRKRELDAMYERWLTRYRVIVEPRVPAPNTAEPAATAAPGDAK
jgi:hypothetical protein